MLNKEKILQGVKQEEKILISRILDKLTAAQNRRIVEFTDFLDLYEQKSLERILMSAKADFKLDGGYAEAERKIIVLLTENNTEFYSLPIEALNITYPGKMVSEISHRDILGSIMSLGIKREKIGDIIVNEASCSILVHKEIADFIVYNLTKIKNVNVYIKKDDINTIKSAVQKFVQITAFVPSLRLDCIVEEGFSIPRSQAVQLIKGGKTFVNWELISKPSCEIKYNDTVSVRGMGRLVFEEVSGKTRRDRLVIKIKRII